MKRVQQLPAGRWSHPIVPYQTWGYFMKDLSDPYQIKISNLAILTGCTFLLQTISVCTVAFRVYEASTSASASTLSQDTIMWGSLLLVLVSIVALCLVIRKLFLYKFSWAALAAIFGELAFFFFAFIPLSKTMFYQILPVLLLLILVVSFIGYGVRRIIIIKKAPPLLTDQEFDAWVEQRAREGLIKTIYKLGLVDEIRSINNLLCVRGYVLPGMRNSRHYNHQDLLSRLGTDGRWRYSINIYTYFYPAEHQIMIFIYDINAMNWADYREATKEYFYEDVIGATTEDEQDTIYINGALFNYRDQRFSLRLCDGYGIGATVRSIPLDNIAGLPTFDMPDSGVDNTIAQLRMLLRTKKWRTS